MVCLVYLFSSLLWMNFHGNVMKKTKLSKIFTGELPLKVHYISASLHLAYDHKYQIQNFSGLVSSVGNVQSWKLTFFQNDLISCPSPNLLKIKLQLLGICQVNCSSISSSIFSLQIHCEQVPSGMSPVLLIDSRMHIHTKV